MEIKELYRIVRPDGGTTVSTSKPDNNNYEVTYRLIADEGKILTNKNGTETACVDTDDPDGWEETGDDVSELAEAARILMGVVE